MPLVPVVLTDQGGIEKEKSLVLVGLGWILRSKEPSYFGFLQ